MSTFAISSAWKSIFHRFRVAGEKFRRRNDSRLASGGLFVCLLAAPATLLRQSNDDSASGSDGYRSWYADDDMLVINSPTFCDAKSEAIGDGDEISQQRRAHFDALSTASPIQTVAQDADDFSRRGIPESRPGFVACARIAGINAAVYLGWWVLPETFMTSWFTTSSVEAYVRPWKGLITALTSSFSHREIWHLGFNMLALMSFGPVLVDGPRAKKATRLSSSEFLGFYVASGILAGLASTGFNIAIRSPQRALGASGALFAIVGYYTMAHPDSRVLILFVLDMSAMQAMHLFNGVNVFLVYRAYTAARKGLAGPMFDGMAHLAGTGVGVSYFFAKSAQSSSVAHGPSHGSGAVRSGHDVVTQGGRRQRADSELGPSAPVRRTHPPTSETDV